MNPCKLVFSTFFSPLSGEVFGRERDGDTARGKSAMEKNTETGGSDPTFSAFSRPSGMWGRSRLRPEQLGAVFFPRGQKTRIPSDTESDDL